MKRRVESVVVAVAVVLGLTLSPAGAADGGFNKANCTFNGKKLYGKIQVVTTFPDVKVQVVTAFPDLKVQRVHAFPDTCGKWEMVDVFADTKVQFVDVFPDVKIEYVHAFPGIP
jgi:hypothetical protein